MKKIGIQAYGVRQRMGGYDEIKQTFLQLRQIGYTGIQTAGCPIPYEDYGRLAAEAGLEIIGTHESWDKIVDAPDDIMEKTEKLGTRTIGIGSLPKKYREDASGLSEFICKTNRFVEIISGNGFEFTYHNHHFEFAKVDGSTVYDRLVNELDEKVRFTFDTYWAQYGGIDVCQMVEQLGKRIKIIHLKDMTISTAQNVLPGKEVGKPMITEVGKGNLNLKGIIATAEKSGVERFVVEQDYCGGDCLDSAKISYDYLYNNFVK